MGGARVGYDEYVIVMMNSTIFLCYAYDLIHA